MNRLQNTSILSLLEKKSFIERRWLGSSVREKRFLDTAPTVALNVVQMAQVWITHNRQRSTQVLGKFQHWLSTKRIIRPLAHIYNP
jgi:hypothetical protein